MISIVNSLRLMAEDWHSRIGYNEQPATLSRAADRIENLEAKVALLRDAVKMAIGWGKTMPLTVVSELEAALAATEGEK